MGTSTTMNKHYNTLYYLAFLEIRRLARVGGKSPDQMRRALIHIGEIADLLHTLPRRCSVPDAAESLTWLTETAGHLDFKYRNESIIEFLPHTKALLTEFNVPQSTP